MAHPVSARLQHKAQFQQGLDQAVVARSPHFVLHAPSAKDLAPDTTPSHWIGAVIPKRWAKRAVTRNAIRRQIYQAWAECFTRMPRGTHVVRLRQPFAATPFKSATSCALKTAVRQELQQLFSQRALT
jgi:ribonuclease P protein component